MVCSISVFVPASAGAAGLDVHAVPAVEDVAHASLPIATPLNGDDPRTRRTVMPELGRPYAMPYSCPHPLLIATRPSPVEMYEASMHTLLLESVCVAQCKRIHSICFFFSFCKLDWEQ
jgi:hypothetical protein